ncbi:PREDICTED: protein SYS1 homolog [Priapulus caudatus]|uniref:Protein SYS1 homolog n=1 Tax=Priapulus caudatus TaxID=37621 RepID=A0ABM1DPL6_PRICU|nr:PREDICTED: protein SYS1 homolog [Priapulus caudatus]
MAGQFRSYKWDPICIISQIIAMQCLFYTSLSIWIVMMNVIVHNNSSLDQIFSYRILRYNELNGRLLMIAFVLNSSTCALGLWYIVQRTKQCLDYSTTVHVVHFLLCWCYNYQMPNTVAWWLLNLVCLILMTVTGEFLCMRTELKAIPVYLGGRVDLL